MYCRRRQSRRKQTTKLHQLLTHSIIIYIYIYIYLILYLSCYNCVHVQRIYQIQQQYAVRFEQHYTAYKQFTKLRFKLETLIGEKPKYGDHSAKHIDTDLLDAWIVKYEDLLESSPIIPQRVFKQVKGESDRKGDLTWTRPPLSPEEEAAAAVAAEKARQKKW